MASSRKPPACATTDGEAIDLSTRIDREGGWSAGEWAQARATIRASNVALPSNTLVSTDAHLTHAPIGISHYHGHCEHTTRASMTSSLSWLYDHYSFQKNVAANKLFTPAQAASYLLEVIGNLTATDSGTCIAWDGKTIDA